MTIAICSLACRYPDAATPDGLWSNLMQRRRSFRALPPTRLSLKAYEADRVGAADAITRVQAGLIAGWSFDRRRFHVPVRTFENTDLTHWLALELADAALAALGGTPAIPAGRTAVIIANTLTGEFSRASLLRLRQPFLDEVLESVFEGSEASPELARQIRAGFGEALKGRFPEPNEDSLAGGLANTIAGRIANYFDLRGGAYSVDGACSSSLVALCNSAELLMSGAVDMVVAGAVDLSLDPFELVGFSRNGALSKSRMRVFDERSDGFWPGEGGAMAVLMREADARRQGLPVLATLRGWGMSTDGAGGLTRPEAGGQYLACLRAHERAGIAPRDVAYVEAHGTGTAIGDPVEIEALARLHDDRATPLPIGSIKANIGHTKAASGFAGLCKVVQSLVEGAVPPHVACERPNRAFEATGRRVEPLARPLVLDDDRPAVAGVSSFGFGGINAHVLLEAGDARRRGAVGFPRQARLVAAEQEAELFAFAAADPAGLRRSVAQLLPVAASLSTAECTDLAAHLADLARGGACRLAFTAAGGEELALRLTDALDWLDAGADVARTPPQLFASREAAKPAVCLLFSGQAAPVRAASPVWRKRFPAVEALAGLLADDIRPGDSDTANAQPAITFANLAGAAVLASLGVAGDGAIGHSLGEIGAMAWAGALEAGAALALARRRGACMAGFGAPGGGMARIELAEADCASFLAGSGCRIACFNGPGDIVIGGPVAGIEALRHRALQAGITFQMLATSHAFHTGDMAAATAPFAAALDETAIGAPQRAFISTVTGESCGMAADLKSLLVRQLVEPVRFSTALEAKDPATTIFVECGPGAGLTRLVRDRGFAGYSIDSQSDDLGPLLQSCAALFAAGADIDLPALFHGRGVQAFEDFSPRALIASPCGSLKPTGKDGPPVPVAATSPVPPPRVPEVAFTTTIRAADAGTSLDAVLRALADETGLSPDDIDAGCRFQADLHMNSLAITRVAVAAAKRLGVRPLANPTDLANASLQALAELLDEVRTFDDGPRVARVSGVRPWFAPYGIVWRDSKHDLGGEVVARRADPLARRIVVPRDVGQAEAEDLIEAIRKLAAAGVSRLEVLHRGAPLSAMLRSLALEKVFALVLNIDLGEAAETDSRVDALCARADSRGYREYRLGRSAGGVEEPVFERLQVAPESRHAPSAGEVILAVGCHRGIGAECALRLAAGGARVVFAGRSDPASEDVAQTLALAKERGIEAVYRQGDVADRTSVGELATWMAGRGLVPGILLHAPAVNLPQRFVNLSRQDVRETLTPKCAGLGHVLDVFGGGLKRVVAFGSIIGRIGLEGEAHYALANALQSRIVEAFGQRHPACGCLSLEWTVWSGAGMGERLGTIERLQAQGVDPLPFEEALRMFETFAASDVTGTICITGRFGQRPDIDLGSARHRPLRFADRKLVDFPGSEIVLETELNAGRDLYLDDHAVLGRKMFPAVMGLEAMAQAASILAAGAPLGPVSDMQFRRAVVVPASGLRIRIAAQMGDDGRIEAAIFCQDDEFTERCQTARFEIGPPQSVGEAMPPPPAARVLADAAGLYGPLFFHGLRFARVGAIHRATSRRVEAAVGASEPRSWFGRYEPSTLVLGDPALFDSALHMLQLAVLHRQVLPVSAARFETDGSAGEVVRLLGSENWTKDGLYSFDILGCDAEGRCAFAWRDVRFRAVAPIDTAPVLALAPVLAEPLLERLARERLDDSVCLALVTDLAAGRGARRDEALRRLGLVENVRRRVDGAPFLVDREGGVGLSHTATSTLAVFAPRPVSCDVVDLGEPLPEGVCAEGWSQGEVFRKLGIPDPFGFGGEAASRGAGIALMREVVGPVGLCVCVGIRHGLQPDAVAHEDNKTPVMH